MTKRRTRVMTLVVLLAGCRESGCSDTAVEHDTEGDDGDDSGDSGDSGDPDAVTCGGAIEIAIVSDDSRRELRVDMPVAFDVRAVYETGHFGLLEDVEFSTDDDTKLRVDAEGVLVPLAAGTVTVTAIACDMETSIDVEIHTGITPSQQMLCEGWNAAITAAATDYEPCFAAPIPEPDCTALEANHDAAFEVLATCVGDEEPAGDDEQGALDEIFVELTTCLRQAMVGDLDCAPAIAFTRAQCSTYVESDCAGVLAPPAICG